MKNEGRFNSVFSKSTERWHFEENLLDLLTQKVNETGRYGLRERKKGSNRIECQNTMAFKMVFDGESMLQKTIDEILVDPETEKLGPLTIKDYNDFRDVFMPYVMSLGNPDDVTALGNHHTGEVVLVYSPLKNYYEAPPNNGYKPIRVKQLLDDLPDDVLSHDGAVSKKRAGSGMTAFLIATKAFDVDAVFIKASRYKVGPKFTYYSGGKVTYESFGSEFREIGDGLFRLTVEKRDYTNGLDRQIEEHFYSVEGDQLVHIDEVDALMSYLHLDQEPDCISCIR